VVDGSKSGGCRGHLSYVKSGCPSPWDVTNTRSTEKHHDKFSSKRHGMTCECCADLSALRYSLCKLWARMHTMNQLSLSASAAASYSETLINADVVPTPCLHTLVSSLTSPQQCSPTVTNFAAGSCAKVMLNPEKSAVQEQH